jgi:hypothetical protein
MEEEMELTEEVKRFEDYWQREGKLGVRPEDADLCKEVARVAWVRSLMAERAGPKPTDYGVSTERLLEMLAARDGAEGALAQAGLLFHRKGRDYNTDVDRDDYFPFGERSYVQMLWVKVQRMKSLALAPRGTQFEGMMDSCLDLISYAAFFADWLKRGGKRAQ